MVDQIRVKAKIESGVLFKISRMKPVIKTTQPHGHKAYHELIFLTNGAGKHWIDVQQYPVAANTIYFILPGQVHCWELTEIPQGFVLMFRTDFLLENHLSEKDLTHLGQRLNGAQILPEQAAEITDLLERMEKEYHQPTVDQGKIVAAYLQIILLKLKQLVRGIAVSDERIESPVVDAFQRLLDELFRTRRQVKQYADLLSISAKYLNDLCKKATGKTASELIEDRVVLEAKKQLIHTTLNVAEIAFALNFQDPSHFAKFFSRCCGMTPTQYRERIR